MYSNHFKLFLERHLLVPSIALACLLPGKYSSAQTVIYDGSQELNFFSSARLTDDFALNNTGDRVGIIASGADPNALEQGDAAWFRAGDRRMRNTNLGSASTAVGVDGDFMSSLFDATGATTTGADANGVGAAYVLYDAGATTGLQTFNVSMYYNDPTPNVPEDPNDPLNGNRDSGGNVGIRIMGIQDTGDDTNPWGDDDFQYSAGSAFAGHYFAGGRHRTNSDAGDQPIVDRLFLAESSYDEPELPTEDDFDPDVILTPSDDWQQLSFQFDAGEGYDYFIFSVSGVGQDANTLGVDRFGFDNISFEPAASAVLGDFNEDGVVNLADLDEYNGNINLAVSEGDPLADLDLDGDGNIGVNDFEQHYSQLVQTSNGGTGTAQGDVNLDGRVDVLNDAFELVNNLGTVATSWADGDINASGNVDVLGDAFALTQNLGFNNGGGTAASPSAAAVPEPGSLSLLGLVGLGAAIRRRR